jgi:hypothetical protein
MGDAAGLIASAAAKTPRSSVKKSRPGATAPLSDRMKPTGCNGIVEPGEEAALFSR